MRVQYFPQARLRFGVAQRDTTPPNGIYMRSWGAAAVGKNAAEGIHRTHYITASAFAPLDGGQPMVLVAMDIGWFQNMQDETNLRQRILDQTGLTSERLLLNMSHTHGSLNLNSEVVDRPGGHLLKPYLNHLSDQISSAVDEAISNLQPAWAMFGYGYSGLATNRDYYDEEAKAWACGYNPARIPDGTLLVGRVTSDDGRVLATLYNYACHPTTLAWDNWKLSPDFIGAAREILEKLYNAPALFLQGALGDQAPRDNYVGDTAIADKNGRQLGYAAAGVIEGLAPAGTKMVYTGIMPSGAALGTWAYAPLTDEERKPCELIEAQLQTVDLPKKQPIPTEKELEANVANAKTQREQEITLRRLLLNKALGFDQVHHMPLWVWRIGQAALVAICNEPYAVVQQTIRKQFPDNAVFVLGTTNASFGYLPPKDTFGQGIYQEWQSPYAAGCMELVTESSIDGITEIMR